MNVQPLLDASLAIQIHVLAGAFAFLCGAYLLATALAARRKGGRTHRLLGRLWIGSMVVLALSALFINQLRVWGPFSPLHIFVPVTLASSWLAVWYARNRQMKAHAQTVIGLYGGGVIVAGGVTFLPGRLMHDVFLKGDGLGYANFADWVLSPYWVPFGGAALSVVIALLYHPRRS